ncbi:hypothetical protein [Sunxiuqinia rutila]|uniref:hypothetical protein n=1 Tax=Sunxiuqinia rutila TaxID=1397841 RepID=UPI003D35A3BE
MEQDRPELEQDQPELRQDRPELQEDRTSAISCCFSVKSRANGQYWTMDGAVLSAFYELSRPIICNWGQQAIVFPGQRRHSTGCLSIRLHKLKQIELNSNFN